MVESDDHRAEAIQALCRADPVLAPSVERWRPYRTLATWYLRRADDGLAGLPTAATHPETTASS